MGAYMMVVILFFGFGTEQTLKREFPSKELCLKELPWYHSKGAVAYCEPVAKFREHVAEKMGACCKEF